MFMNATATEVPSEKVLIKIQKLLALGGNNPSQEEATSAITRARELMAKYNVSEVQLRGSETTEKISMTPADGLVRGSWMKSLSLIIGNNFRCKTFAARVPNGLNIEFFGHETDGEIAAQMFTYTIRVIKTEAYHYGSEHGRETRNDFILGFLEGLKEAFRRQDTSFQNDRALVLASQIPEDVMEAYRKLSGRGRSISVPSMRIQGSEHARNAGRESGHAHGSGLGRQIPG
jgi:hypothetical protein